MSQSNSVQMIPVESIHILNPRVRNPKISLLQKTFR